jgi:DNA-binding transcriptional LysR family regulator
MPHRHTEACSSPSMRGMDLRRLEHFLAVVDLGTVTAAAERGMIAQPALSRHIALLEREVGVPLFVRGGRRLTVTAAGQVFAIVARELLDHAARVEATAASLASGQPLRLVVAAPMATLNELIAPFVATLGPEDPVVTSFDNPPLRGPENVLGRADVVICGAPASSRLSTRVLGEVTLCAQVPAVHRFARERRQTVDVSELAGEALVVQTRENMSRLLLDSALAAHGMTAPIVAECEVERMVQALAASGRGVGILTERPHLGLHAIRITDHGEPLQMTLIAAWEPSHYASARIDDLMARLGDYLGEVSREIAAAQHWDID